VVQTPFYTVIVPQERLRLQLDHPEVGDLVLYEDLGPPDPESWGGRTQIVYRVQRSTDQKSNFLLERVGSELVRTISTEAVLWQGQPAERYRLFVPDREELTLLSGTVLHGAICVYGITFRHGGMYYRVETAWNLEFDLSFTRHDQGDCSRYSPEQDSFLASVELQ
jgi:hypothetical protein